MAFIVRGMNSITVLWTVALYNWREGRERGREGEGEGGRGGREGEGEGGGGGGGEMDYSLAKQQSLGFYILSLLSKHWMNKMHFL